MLVKLQLNSLCEHVAAVTFGFGLKGAS